MSHQAPQQQAAYAPPAAAKPRKKRRIFLWFFLAIQVIFLIWIITAASSAHATPTHAEVLKGCANGAWQGLFKSYSDCMTHYASGLKQAGEAGNAIGFGLVIVFWVVVDFLVTIPWAVYRLATRTR